MLDQGAVTIKEDGAPSRDTVSPGRIREDSGCLRVGSLAIFVRSNIQVIVPQPSLASDPGIELGLRNPGSNALIAAISE